MDRQKVLRNAEKLVSKGKIDAAIKQYRKVLDDSPRDTTTLNRVGDLYVRAKRLDDAMALFHRAAEHFSDEGFFVKGIAIYKKILRLDPSQLDVYEKLAHLYHKQGLSTEAKHQFEVVADYHLSNDDLASAVGVHERIVEIVPQDATAHLRLAEMYQRAGRPEDALSQYREIAVLMLEHGKVDEALRVYRSALEVDASDLGFIASSVERLKDAGHVAAARELMTAAVELNPAASELDVVDDRRGADSDVTTEAEAVEPRADESPVESPEIAEPDVVEAEVEAEEVQEAAPEIETSPDVETELEVEEPTIEEPAIEESEIEIPIELESEEAPVEVEESESEVPIEAQADVEAEAIAEDSIEIDLGDLGDIEPEEAEEVEIVLLDEEEADVVELESMESAQVADVADPDEHRLPPTNWRRRCRRRWSL